MPILPFMPRTPLYRPYYYPPKITNEFSNKNKIPNMNKDIHEKTSSPQHKQPSESQKTTITRGSYQDDDAIFDLFGIQLRFDDILLICLIFFLYSEGVKDEMLFISLILLLLS